MELRLLGPVEVWSAGHRLPIGHARQRCVLAILAAEANRVVTVDQLIDRVWADQPPPSALTTIYGYLSRLRQALTSVDDIRITRESSGYLLSVDPTIVDLYRFQQLVAQSRAVRDDDRAVALFDEALHLWHGEAFATLDTPWLNTLRQTLDAERRAAELDRAQVLLRSGQHVRLVPELSARAAAHPLDEHVAGQLMLALYRSGRAADALETYQHIRELLATELGSDPGEALQRLHRQILTTDPALAIPVVSASSPSALPRQLPARTPHFVDRQEELQSLSRLLETGATALGGGAMIVAAIDGTAGIGKTALAVHWAHQIADRFGDGQLYVNLRGFDPTNPPANPAEVVRGFLDAFGIAPERIPVTLDAQTALYRSLLATRKVLILLDNARDTQQVRPLLPGGIHCLVVITSRNQLTGLLTQEGARPITVDLLSTVSATALLARHLGNDRIGVEPTATAELIDHCARLPLALAIVAARAMLSRGVSLRALVEELRDGRTRLDTLDAGDRHMSIRTVFSWSYRILSPDAARLFRLLGLHCGPDVSVTAAARLADRSDAHVRPLLVELARAHLIIEQTPGRYAFHELLRVYAAECADETDALADRDAAIRRMLLWYLHTADAADSVINPQRPRVPLGPTDKSTRPLRFSGYDEALRWLETERANLVAATHLAADVGEHAVAAKLPTAMFSYLSLRKRWIDWIATHQRGLVSARHIGDQLLEGALLLGLSDAYFDLRRFDDAIDHARRALPIWREMGFQMAEALTLALLGASQRDVGRPDDALATLHQALVLWRVVGDRWGEGVTLHNLGDAYRQLGRYDDAINHFGQSTVVRREIGDQWGLAWSLHDLASTYQDLGQFDRSVDIFRQALTIRQQIGDQHGQARTLRRLGQVYRRTAQTAAAREAWQQAHAIFTDLGDARAAQIRSDLNELDPLD